MSDFVTPWTVACQAPLPMGVFRQEYWSGLPFPSPGDFPDPEFEPGSPTLQADSLLFEHQGSPIVFLVILYPFLLSPTESYVLKWGLDRLSNLWCLHIFHRIQVSLLCSFHIPLLPNIKNLFLTFLTLFQKFFTHLLIYFLNFFYTHFTPLLYSKI